MKRKLKMNTIIPKAQNLFFPQPLKGVTFTSAADATKMQQIARITKTALFAIFSFSMTTLMVLSEASFITWPLAVGLISVALITGGLFYLLHSLDHKYVDGLDDTKRANLAEEAINRIFHSKPLLSEMEITKTLKGVNSILGNTIFNKQQIFEIICLAKEANENQSIADVAAAKNIHLFESCTSEWEEKGRFGLPSYCYNFQVNWDSSSGKVNVCYTCKKIKSTTDTEESTEELKELLPSNI